MTELMLDYLLLICLSTCGILQIVAHHSNLKGLLFFHNQLLTYLFGFLTILGSFCWFFGLGSNRLQEEIMHTGLEGAEQVEFFLMGALAGIILTLVVSSLVPSGEGCTPGEEIEKVGLDRLREKTFLSLLREHFRKEERKDGPPW